MLRGTNSVSRPALRTLTIGLRAHLTGVRDHVSECEAEVIALALSMQDERNFAQRTPGKKLGRPKKIRL